MDKLNIKKLTVKWSVSRAKDTYGYNICRLIDNSQDGKVYKTLGGGYDMLGTVLANFVQDEYQSELMKHAELAHSLVIDGKYKGCDKKGFYGMFAYYEGDKLVKITLDGACGISSIERIIKDVLSLTLERVYNYDRKGRAKDTIGFYIYPQTL